MDDRLIIACLGCAGLLMAFASPFVAFWNFGAAVMFLVVGIGFFLGAVLSS